MKNRISDQDVFKLLANLKNTEGTYSPDMIKSRRDIYVKQVATMAAFAGARGSEIKQAGTGQTITSSTAGSGLVTGKLLETVLVAALVIEAGVAAYIYRDEIADFINSTFTSEVETVASPPVDLSSDIAASDEPSTETPEGTVTIIVTETPSPPGALLPEADNNEGNEDAEITSTPDLKDDPGLHLGQTKQPTKDPIEDNKNNLDSKDKKD